MDAAEEMDALASPRVQSHKDSTVDGGAARPRASIFEGFSIPGLRGKAAAKVTAPAKQTRPDKNSILVKRQSEAAASSGAGDSPVLRGVGAQPVIPEQDEDSRRGSEMVEGSLISGRTSSGETVDEEAARRVAWIQHHLREGNEQEAYELGWDGDMGVLDEELNFSPTPPPSPPSPPPPPAHAAEVRPLPQPPTLEVLLPLSAPPSPPEGGPPPNPTPFGADPFAASSSAAPATATTSALAAEVEEGIASSLLCPITQELMRDPVFTMDGQTYERSAIEEWLKTNDTSPATGKRLPSKMLVDNVSARGMIRELLERQPELAKAPGGEP